MRVSSAASSGCEDEGFLQQGQAHGITALPAPRLAALLGEDAGCRGDDLGIAGSGGHRGGERLLGLRVAAHSPEHAGADEPAIGIVGRRLAVDQRVRLAAKHVAQDQARRRDGRGQRRVEGAAIRFLDVAVGVGQGLLRLVPASEVVQDDRPRPAT